MTTYLQSLPAQTEQQPFLYANIEKVTDVCTPEFKAKCPALAANYALKLYAAPIAQTDQQPATSCDHQWVDDGQYILVCTSCGAQEDHDPGWQDMATAPRDGTLVQLLVEFDEHATEDTDGPAPTIGANNYDNDGEDRWQFAGWCWSHDHFTEGKGTPVGWLPIAAPIAQTAPEQSQAAADVLAERRRQVEAEGWTPAHDDLYCAAELPRAAAAYILNGANDEAPCIWPFASKWWKPKEARPNYVRAGALILAEIERLDRQPTGSPEGLLRSTQGGAE
ncbi:hypothetical protein MCB86_16725 [Pseudomonas sp. KSR10]|uniref:hypothetical protein n=1 Tax=Pseudomonas sp. KSR10 TaxID=2916654 RepID=UPI001EF83063|nr:hypothetical protein [Pseudomonas sp. KSR10]MCG6541719.1 hypothetical protein [Pseudomonas sp. KSR10]